MATAESESHEFVIDAKADRLLSDLSRDLSALILDIAASQTENRTSKGVPLVDSCNISDAASFLCEAIRKAIDSGQIKPEASETMNTLTQLCDVATRECIQDGGRTE